MEQKTDILEQVKIAKEFPRNLKDVLSKIQIVSTMDQETAESCFYAFMDNGKVITGLTIRFAEIIAASWGNLRTGTKVISNNGKELVAEAFIHDLETNVSVSVQVKKSLIDFNGRPIKKDLHIQIGNVACSIAFRNAIYKAIPSTLFRSIIEEVKQASIGDQNPQEAAGKVITYFTLLGVTDSDILKTLSIESMEEIDREKLFMLKGIRNAIQMGEISIKEAFGKPLKSKKSRFSQLVDEDTSGEKADSPEATEEGSVKESAHSS